MESAVISTIHFTCIGRGHGAPCYPATRETWDMLRREKWLKEMCERIEKGDDELKHRLPVWTPHCAEFKGNHRAIGDALKPLSRLMLDFDEKGHTGEILEKLKMENGKWKDAGLEVLLVEESVRRGTHVLVELPTGMNAEEAQQLMQEVTGFEPDKAVKDVARCIYMVPEDHTKFVSDKLFTAKSRTHPDLPLKGRDEITPRPLRERQGEGPLYLCDTLEPQWRDYKNGGRKIPGRSAIPEGRYLVLITWSPKFKQWLPLLWNVPKFSGIRIHAGNKPEDTEGCILVGKNQQVGRLIDSRFWVHRLKQEISDAHERGEKVYLTIH